MVIKIKVICLSLKLKAIHVNLELEDYTKWKKMDDQEISALQ